MKEIERERERRIWRERRRGRNRETHTSIEGHSKKEGKEERERVMKGIIFSFRYFMHFSYFM